MMLSKQEKKRCFCVVYHGAHGGECTHTLLASAHRHTDRDTRTNSAFWAYLCTVNHGAHGGEIYITLTHHTHHTETQHCTATAPPHYAHTRTRTGRKRKRRCMVKSGNIKVDLRSGAAVSQERTRTHARTRAGHFEHFPASVCAAFVCFSLPLLCRFLTLFCRAF